MEIAIIGPVSSTRGVRPWGKHQPPFAAESRSSGTNDRPECSGEDRGSPESRCDVTDVSRGKVFIPSPLPPVNLPHVPDGR